VLIYDEFTDANGTAITSHTIAPTNTPATAWETLSGTVQIQGNRARCIVASNGVAVDAGIADHEIDVMMHPLDSAGSDSGILTRTQDVNNFWMLRWRHSASPAMEIFSRIGGGFTLHASTSKSASVVGESYQAVVTSNGASITMAVGSDSVTYGSASALQTATKAGLRLTSVNAEADDFQVSTL
jgi:hypothetical protein